MADNTRRTKLVGIRLPVDLIAALQERAAADDRNMSNLVVHLLRKALREGR